MPFHPPFKPRFEQGDLVYGLARPRGRYPFDFPQFYDAHDCHPASGARQISRIDQYAAIRSEQREQQCFNKQVPANQQAFLDSLERHPKYRKVLSAREPSVTAVARKCKGGLAWASSSGISVHFLLDQMDMERVVRKLHRGGVDAKSFTGCELRWIYRNRKNPEVQRAVQFWMSGEPVPPPWEGSGAAMWALYKPTREFSPSSASVLSRLFGCWGVTG